ncbi:HAD-IA family hydrolase [Fulvivirga sp. M361]|uniref:HAD-IA family hydrolase n=1 Tax=Fulvivirga sp. M361 TaxID=2594266 RepID=UPI0016252A6E|nr:HAD-IA family hydrolase [Fulvivirga sp. M361]
MATSNTIDSCKIKAVLFDFDGTLANTLTLGLEVFNNYAKTHGYKEVNSQDQLEQYRSMSTLKIIESMGISLIKLPFIVSDLRKRMGEKIHLVEPIGNIVPVVKVLAKRYTLGIITSNSRHNVDIFLNRHNLTDEFQYFSTSIKLFGKSKRLKRFLAREKLDPDHVVMIGDETRDIEAARKCGVSIISVSWGFQTFSVLNQMQPDFLVSHPHEIQEILT